MLMGGWDNVAHFSMVHMIRRFGAVVSALPPPTPGATWQFASYPQGFHAVAAGVVELLIGPDDTWLGPELVAYTQAMALVVIAVATTVVAGFCALPAVRRRPVLALPVAAFVSAVFLLGPGSLAIGGGIANFAVACGLAVAVVLLVVPAARVVSPLTLAAIGGAVVGVATTWVLLLALAGPALLALVLPLRRQPVGGVPGARRGVGGDRRRRWCCGLAHTAVVLSRVQAANPLTIDGGRVHVDFGLLVAAGLAIVGIGVALVRGRPAGRGAHGDARRGGGDRGVVDPAPGRGQRRDHLLRPEVPARRGGRPVRGAGGARRAPARAAKAAPPGPRPRRAGVRDRGAGVDAGLRAHRHRPRPSASPPEAPGVTNAVKETQSIAQPPAAADLADRIAHLDAPLPAFWIDLAGDRRVSPILAGQWFLAFTDTWTLEANAMATITTLRAPDEVPAVAERILLRRPDAVVVVRREDLAAVRRAVGPELAPPGLRAVTRGAVAAVAAVLAAAVVALSLGLFATPVGVADNGDGTRLYCGAGLVPDTPSGRSNWQGGVVLDFSTGAPACPDAIASAALPALRLATLGSGPTWSLTRLGVLYALAVGVLTGLAAWAVGPGLRLLALVPALVPLVGPTFTRFFLSTFSEPAGLLGAYGLCLGAAAVAVTGRRRCGRGPSGWCSWRRAGSLAATAKASFVPLLAVALVVAAVTAVGRRRWVGLGVGGSAGAGGLAPVRGGRAVAAAPLRRGQHAQPRLHGGAARRRRRRARPARPAARGARRPRAAPTTRTASTGCRGPRSSRPTRRPPAAPRTGCCSRTRRPRAGALGRGLTATLGAGLSYLPSAPVTPASVPAVLGTTVGPQGADRGAAAGLAGRARAAVVARHGRGGGPARRGVDRAAVAGSGRGMR